MDFIKIFLFYSKINHRTTSYKTAILEVPSGIMHYLEIVPKFFSFLFELTPTSCYPVGHSVFLEIQLWKVKNCHFRVKIIIKYFTIFSNFSVFQQSLESGEFRAHKTFENSSNNNYKLLVLHNHNL